MANPGRTRPVSLPPLDQSEGPLNENIGRLVQLFPELTDKQLYGEDYDYAAAVRALIEDARDFEVNWLAPIREYAAALYEGAIPEPVEEGRSSIVMSEVRDLVLSMLPSIIRIFRADRPCNFLPRSEADVAMAKAAQDYVGYVYDYDNPGFLNTNAVIKDALIKTTGVMKWWTEHETQVIEQSYRNLSLPQRQYVISQQGVEVVSEEQVGGPNQGPQQPGAQVIEPRFNITIRRRQVTPKHRVEAVPPDEFRISREAKNIPTAALVGHERQVPLSQLAAMGYTPESLEEYFGSGPGASTVEADLRNPGRLLGSGTKDPGQGDPLIWYGEWYIRIDKDGDGIPELRMICTLGDGDVIVKDEPAPRARFALFCPDPEPHTAIGHGAAEQVEDLQRIKSNVLRNMLDAIASTILPRLVVVDTMANMEDVQNNELGSIIRVKSADAVQALKTGEIGPAPMLLLDYMDKIAMRRTGVNDQSKGIDPKAMQSTSTPGIQMLVTGAQERTVLVAQTLAETGFRDLYKGLLQEIVENPIPERQIRLRGDWQTIMPDQFDATMDVEVNPAMGKGNSTDRVQMLVSVKQTQEMILQTQGVGNPLVSPIEYRNTLQDLLAEYGMMEVGRYFRQITPEQVQAAAQAQAEKPDANMVVAQAEADKVRAQVVKILTDAKVKLADTKLTDDRERDKLIADTAVKVADLQLQGSAQTLEAIQTLIDQPRPESAEVGAEGIPEAGQYMTPPEPAGAPTPQSGAPQAPPGPDLAGLKIAAKLPTPPPLSLPPGFGAR